MNNSSIPTKEKFPLSKKKILKKSIGSIFSGIISTLFFIFCGFSGFFQNLGKQDGSLLIIMLILIAILALISILSILYQVWYFKSYFYELDADYIQIRKNPITPREITIPYERIQDVYVDQDLLDRILGIYDVHVSSATISSGMAAHIDGVDKKSADGLRSQILQTVKDKLSLQKKQTYE